MDIIFEWKKICKIEFFFFLICLLISIGSRSWSKCFWSCLQSQIYHGKTEWLKTFKIDIIVISISKELRFSSEMIFFLHFSLMTVINSNAIISQDFKMNEDVLSLCTDTITSNNVLYGQVRTCVWLISVSYLEVTILHVMPR